jgi:hypothetical protein
MREPPAPAWAAFAWVVCQRESDGKFLLVNEPAGICGSARPAYWCDFIYPARLLRDSSARVSMFY